MIPSLEWTDFGRHAYEAYSEALGDGVFPWHEMSPREQAAWINAARRAIAKFTGFVVASQAEGMKDLTPASPMVPAPPSTKRVLTPPPMAAYKPPSSRDLPF